MRAATTTLSGQRLRRSARRGRESNRQPLTITPEFTFIASPGQEIKANILDALSHKQKAQVERARKAGRTVDINGRIVVSFLEIGQGESRVELPGTGLVLDGAIKFDAKLRHVKSIEEVLDMLTNAYVRKNALWIRTQLGEDSYKVTRVAMEDDDASLTLVKESTFTSRPAKRATTRKGAEHV